MNRRLLLIAGITLSSFIAGVFVAALFSSPAGYVSYTVEAPETGEPEVVPFHLDLGTLQPGDSGYNVQTSFTFDTSQVGSSQTYAFSIESSFSEISQTFSLFDITLDFGDNNVIGLTISNDESGSSYVLCGDVTLDPDSYEVSVTIHYTVSSSAESVTQNDMLLLTVQEGSCQG